MEETNNKNSQVSYLKPHLIPQSHPWLIFCHGKHKQRQTFYSISKNRYYIKIIPEIRNKLICCSSNDGWLLLEDLYIHNYSFINFRTVENIQLPQTSLKVRSYVPLKYPTDDNNGCVLFVCMNNFLLIWNNGESDFTEFHIELEDGDDIIEAIMYGECMYGLTQRFKLVKTENYPTMPMRFESPIIEEMLLSKRHFRLPWKTYMVTSCNELMVFIQNYSHLSFEIFRADFAKRTWEEVNDIGNQTIFLSTSIKEDYKCCFIIEDGSKSGILSNSIYFSEMGHFYIFDLKYHSILMFRPCPIVSRCNSFQYWLNFDF